MPRTALRALLTSYLSYQPCGTEFIISIREGTIVNQGRGNVSRSCNVKWQNYHWIPKAMFLALHQWFPSLSIRIHRGDVFKEICNITSSFFVRASWLFFPKGPVCQDSLSVKLTLQLLDAPNSNFETLAHPQPPISEYVASSQRYAKALHVIPLCRRYAFRISLSFLHCTVLLALFGTQDLLHIILSFSSLLLASLSFLFFSCSCH